MSFKSFFDAYVECALWSSVDDDGEPLDSGWNELAPATLADMEKDCRDFYDAHGDDLPDDSQGGHDFWLTRNRHGAGFWDRGLGELGNRLSDAARAYGECDLYIGDDDMIYQA